MGGVMAKSSRRRAAEDVLCYRRVGPSQATVWRHYLRWRQAQNPPLPIRCDNPLCFFHTSPLVWNGLPFKPILDHRDGNNSDNRPSMLRLLCPICDAQQPTRGGANKGRIIKSEGGFAKVSKGGKRDYILFPETGILNVTGESGSSNGTTGRPQNEPIDLRELKFDNNVIVGDGVIALDGLTWRVPRNASHATGSDRVTMKLARVTG